jgi:hypothetical protein
MARRGDSEGTKGDRPDDGADRGQRRRKASVAHCRAKAADRTVSARFFDWVAPAGEGEVEVGR